MLSQQQQSNMANSNEQQWRDYYTMGTQSSTQYPNQYHQYHQETGLNFASLEQNEQFLFELNQLNYDSISNQDNSPNATSRYTPQSQC